MRKRFAFFFLLFLLLTNAFGQRFDKEYGTPVIVLTQINPWLQVIGSDVPDFALYDKGRIIYKKSEAGKPKYFEVKLNEAETQQAVYALGITDSLMQLSSFIEVSQATDQPTNELVLNFDSTKIISVYGNLKTDQKARKQTPKAFLTVYDRIIRYQSPKAKEWVPSSIEVFLTEYSHSPETPRSWPKNWPDLKDSKKVRRSENLYSLYLDKNQLEELKQLVGSLKKNQAVLVNGKKFSVSYRFPFPNLR
jgi:hypothetical protein